MTEPVTGKTMCELIARWQKEAYNKDIDPESIWKFSPTGELDMVFGWYEQAIAYFKHAK